MLGRGNATLFLETRQNLLVIPLYEWSVDIVLLINHLHGQLFAGKLRQEHFRKVVQGAG